MQGQCAGGTGEYEMFFGGIGAPSVETLSLPWQASEPCYEVSASGVVM